MFQPSDEKLQDLVAQATDDLISRTEDFLDEGAWVDQFYKRCEALGLEPMDASKMRQVADEILALQLAKHMLARLVVEESHTDRVFIQGSGWIEDWRQKGKTL